MSISCFFRFELQLRITSITIPANQMEVMDQNQLRRLEQKLKEITEEPYLVDFGVALPRLLRMPYGKESPQRRQRVHTS